MPILVMDVFEHAFMLDYGLKRADYVEAFIKNIDWKAVEPRLNWTGLSIEERNLHSFTEEI